MKSFPGSQPSAHDGLSSSQLSVSACDDILRACEQLEAAWRRGDRRPASEFLDAVPPSRRGMVLAVLDGLVAELSAERPSPKATSGTGVTPEVTGGATGSPLPTVSDPEQEEPRYSIIRPLGQGGMGQVSEAFDRELDRPVALKEILPSGALDPNYRARFQTEAAITAHLEHPGIIPIYSRGRFPDGRLYYTMRLIEGDRTGTLQRALREFHASPPANPSERDLAFRNLVRRVIDVCETMSYAHTRGVLHRDLKPSNILLGPNGETLVVDWGLARWMQGSDPERFERLDAAHGKDDSSRLTAGVGTVGHMAPEQSAGLADASTPASDIYSLGTILYAVLTGNTPAAAPPAGLSNLLQQVGLPAEPPSPRAIAGTVDPAVEAICLKAMARDPASRYATAGELAEDLERFLAGEPVRAWREPWPRRLARWVGRRRTLVVATALAMLLSILGLGALSFIQERNRELLSQQTRRLDDALGVSRAAQADAERQRNRAEGEERLALQAVGRFHRAVAANPELRNSATLTRLRHELLTEPIDYYRGVRERLLSVTQPSLDNLAALRDATFELAKLQIEVGDLEAGCELLRQQVEFCAGVRRGLPPDDRPAMLAWTEAEARAHLSWGTALLREENAAGQLEHHLAAVAGFQSLLDQGQTAVPVVTGFADAQAGAGHALSILERRDEAQERFKAALQWQQVALKLAPDDPEVRRGLARLRLNYSLLLTAQGKTELARRQVAEGQRLFRELGDDAFVDIHAGHRLAASRLNEAVSLQQQSRPAEALEAYRQSEREWRRLAAQFPAHNEFQNGLGQTLWSIAFVLRQLNRPAEALPVWLELATRERAEVARRPRAVESRGKLLEALHSLGHTQIMLHRGNEARGLFREALSLAAELLTEAPADPRWIRQVLDLHVHEVSYLQDAGDFAAAVEQLVDQLPLLETFALRSDLVPTDRALIRSVLTRIAEMREILGDQSGAATAWRRVRVADEADPALRRLDQRLQSVLAGTSPADVAERLQLAQRAADRGELAAAVTLYEAGEFPAEPQPLADRGPTPRLRGADAALRAAAATKDAGQARQWRSRALAWLREDWQRWREVANTNHATAVAVLGHWKSTPGISLLRQPACQATLPEEERRVWQELLDSVWQFLSPGDR